MATTPQQVVNEALQEFAVEFIRHRIADARKAKLAASGRLVRSFESDIAKATTNEVASVFIAFEGYGRFHDLKRLKKAGGGQAYVKELEKWIQQVGVDKFKAKFGRKYRIPATSERLINQIAWGIIKKKRRKRRRWYSKNRERDIDNLYKTLLEGYAAVTLDNIKKSTLNGGTQG